MAAMIASLAGGCNHARGPPGDPSHNCYAFTSSRLAGLGRLRYRYGIGTSTRMVNGPDGNASAWTVNTRKLRPS
jgi:hypothetical protein